jgi:hypothetical protein
LLEHFAHPQIESGPAKFQRVFQAAIYLDVEPAIDPPLQKVQRKSVDQRHRRDGQHRENARQPQGQTRAGDPVAIQAYQSDQVVQNQDGQGAQSDGADQQQPRVHLPELGRVGGGAAHQHQDDQQQAQQQQDRR